MHKKILDRIVKNYKMLRFKTNATNANNWIKTVFPNNVSEIADELNKHYVKKGGPAPSSA